MANTWTTLLDVVYPVGSVYITGSETSPASTFGGTWSQVKSGLLGCAGSTGLAENLSTGGSSTISVNQMPSHAHSVPLYWADYGGSSVGHTTYWGNHIGASMTSNATGGGQPYYPAHISFNVYRRTA